jgi:hypothetical protein
MKLYGTFWERLDFDDKVELAVIIASMVAVFGTVCVWAFAMYYLVFSLLLQR